ncbi:MAG: hypothetical protein K6F48_09940 [Paludibacteraceae bacterium]|nr:hypothetical protein [Paludibacteraceae bacterium]
MEERKVIEVNSGSYFPTVVVAIGFILLMGALSLLICKLYYSLTIDIFKPWGTIIVEFLKFEFPLMVLLSAVGFFLLSTRRITCFDPEKKTYFRGAQFLSFRRGEWKPLVLDGYKFIAFQKYDKNFEYQFGFLMNRHVEEHVYDLRFVKPDNTFVSFVSASDFRAVAEIVKLGNLLSKIYQVPFCDYVKQALLKNKVLDFTDGDDWPTV